MSVIYLGKDGELDVCVHDDGTPATKEEIIEHKNKWDSINKITLKEREEKYNRINVEDKKSREELIIKMIPWFQEAYSCSKEVAEHDLRDTLYSNVVKIDDDFIYHMTTALFDISAGSKKEIKIWKDATKKHFGQKIYKEILLGYKNGNHDT